MARTEGDHRRDTKRFLSLMRFRPAAYGTATGASIAMFLTPVVDPSKAPRLVVVLAFAVGLSILALLLLVYLVERHRYITHSFVIEYVEDLRQYTVANFGELRKRVDVVGDVHRESSEAPPEHVPTVSPESLLPRERNTLLKIIYGMAVAAPYRFDPEGRRGDAAAIIASATAAAGCSVSDDTVRKWLREAAKVAR